MPSPTLNHAIAQMDLGIKYEDGKNIVFSPREQLLKTMLYPGMAVDFINVSKLMPEIRERQEELSASATFLATLSYLNNHKAHFPVVQDLLSMFATLAPMSKLPTLESPRISSFP